MIQGKNEKSNQFYRYLNYSFIASMLGYSIFMIVQYRYNPALLFKGISVVLLLVFLYFFGNYVRKYL